MLHSFVVSPVKLSVFLPASDDPEGIPLEDLAPNPPSDYITMKFNHSLQFNAVPEWTSEYIAYSQLKKLIYSLERTALGVPNYEDEDEENSTLIREADSNPEDIFKRALDDELKKIDSFYMEREQDIYLDLDRLIEDEAVFQAEHAGHEQGYCPQDTDNEQPFRLARSRSSLSVDSTDGEDLHNQLSPVRSRARQSFGKAVAPSTIHSDDSDEDVVAIRRKRTRSQSGARRRPSWFHHGGEEDVFSNLYDMRITLKKRATAVYVSLCELRSYSQLNKTGFSKALKKFDKTLDRHIRESYLENMCSKTYIFSRATEQNLDHRVDEAVDVYARLATNGDVKIARQELRLHLREHIVWERNTVWRDMIGMERKAQAANLNIIGGNRNVRLQGEEPTSLLLEKVDYVMMWGFRLPRAIVGRRAILCLIGLGILLTFIHVITPFDSDAQNNCLAIIVLASFFWATEALPLFVTSMMLPFLVVLLRVNLGTTVDKHGNTVTYRLTAPAAADVVFSQMWSSVIMLLLGGFTLAAALSKYDIAKILATAILSKAGTSPRVVLLTLMFVAWFLSMWISNVASPVLCYSISQPLLRTLPPDSTFAKAVILGIALAANVGGMGSPIASPQNLIALENMDPIPTWMQWFAVAIPVSIVSILMVWFFLMLTFPPGDLKLTPIRRMREPYTGKQYFVVFGSLVTIVLWCMSQKLEPVLGNMGVIALIPIVLFFGTGLLTTEDFNNFLWTIIALAMGGVVMGKAVASSGLLATIASAISIKLSSLDLFGVIVVFGMLVLVVATFVSHTVAALVILPLVKTIGESLPDPQPRILVMVSALLCSAAMGLPTSGFPNVTAICMTDEMGRRYLTVSNFITRGVPSSILVYIAIITIGYFFMVVSGY